MTTIGLVLRDVDGSSPADLADQAETAGFDAVWMSELWGPNAFVELGTAIEATENIRLGTGIVNVYSRTPALLAMGAASLGRRSGGRARLGLGVSSRAAIETVHGLDFEVPADRTGETIELVRSLLEGDEPVSFEGEFYGVKDVPPLSVDVPIYAAALGPKNRRMTGRFADGWLPNNVPVSHLSRAFEAVAEGAATADRNPDEITVAPWVYAVVSDDPDAAADAVRAKAAYYVGNSLGYERALAEAFPTRTAAVADAWREGNHDAARERVSDKMVSALGAAGTTEAVHQRLGELAAADLVDELVLNVPAHLDDDAILETMDALDPDAIR